MLGLHSRRRRRSGPRAVSNRERTASSSLLLLALASAASLVGCETLLGGGLDGQFVRSNSCVPECSAGTRCDTSSLQCVCAPAVCEDGTCGARLDPRCGLAQDCGPCPSGLYCGSETPNQCSTAACTPQTCEQLGQSSGVHATCGILVDCNPKASCDGCEPGQVCTAKGCCTPFVHPEGSCGALDDGCGNVTEVSCVEGAALACEDNECCEVECPRDAVCGLNPSCGSTYVDCDGTCPDGTTCNVKEGRFVCGGCVATCPDEASATCGANPGMGCSNQTVQCVGQCPPGERCVDYDTHLACCRPACPATPPVCGANDDGCGGLIQCPGPCSEAGFVCRSSESGFACVPP